MTSMSNLDRWDATIHIVVVDQCLPCGFAPRAKGVGVD